MDSEATCSSNSEERESNYTFFRSIADGPEPEPEHQNVILRLSSTSAQPGNVERSEKPEACDTFVKS